MFHYSVVYKVKGVTAVKCNHKCLSPNFIALCNYRSCFSPPKDGNLFISRVTLSSWHVVFARKSLGFSWIVVFHMNQCVSLTVVRGIFSFLQFYRIYIRSVWFIEYLAYEFWFMLLCSVSFSNYQMKKVYFEDKIFLMSYKFKHTYIFQNVWHQIPLGVL